MNRYKLIVLVAAMGIGSANVALGQAPAGKKDEKVVVTGAPVTPPPGISAAPADSVTEASVTVGGQAIAYRAVAGTLTVGYDDAHDALLGLDGKMMADTGEKIPDKEKPDEAPATARTPRRRGVR